MKKGACRKHPSAKAKPPSFVWVLEYTKKGTPHLHVAVDQYVPRGWIQKHWVRLTGAWNVDVRGVDAENVTTYLSKYMGKTLDTLQGARRSKGEALAVRGLHIYGASPDMKPWVAQAPNPEWELIKVGEDIGALQVERLAKEELEISSSEPTNVEVPLVRTDQTFDRSTPSLSASPRDLRPPGVGPARARQSERREEGRLMGKGPPGCPHEA